MFFYKIIHALSRRQLLLEDMGRIHGIINVSLNTAMKSGINFSIFCIIGITASGCGGNKPENAGVAEIVGTLSRRGPTTSECVAGTCFDIPSRILYCPNGYVRISESECRRVSTKTNSNMNSWGLNRFASGIKESIGNLSKIKPPKPPEFGDNKSKIPMG